MTPLTELFNVLKKNTHLAFTKKIVRESRKKGFFIVGLFICTIIFLILSMVFLNNTFYGAFFLLYCISLLGLLGTIDFYEKRTYKHFINKYFSKEYLSISSMIKIITIYNHLNKKINREAFIQNALNEIEQYLQQPQSPKLTKSTLFIIFFTVLNLYITVAGEYFSRQINTTAEFLIFSSKIALLLYGIYFFSSFLLSFAPKHTKLKNMKFILNFIQNRLD